MVQQQKKRPDTSRDSYDRDILVKDANIWIGNGFARGSILIEDGQIVQVARKIDKAAAGMIDATGLYALPGLVDAHVHLRDMQLAYKEDFATGTAAAAAGGFTTVLDMPNTVPPTDSSTRLVEKQRRAARRAYVNIGFHAAAVSDSKTVESLSTVGAFSLKLYMPKPIAPFDVGNNDKVREMMYRAERARIPVTVHAEAYQFSRESDVSESFEKLAGARSPLLETTAVRRITRIQRTTGCRVHYCHLTLSSSLNGIASGSGKMTSEVAPHHLLLSKRLLRRLAWKGWMVPPLRSEGVRRALLAAAVSGSADVIASDHAPHTIEEKEQQPGRSLPGVPGLETTLPLMLTLVNKNVIRLGLLVRLLAENPARIFGLKSKAKLQRGRDGDVTLIDLKRKSKIDSSRFLSKAKFSPFDGFETRGAVVATIVAGRLVYNGGVIVGRQGDGAVLRADY